MRVTCVADQASRPGEAENKESQETNVTSGQGARRRKEIHFVV